ncbi:MAG: HAMP domain-containing sensor histidine kinase [Alphaproteobacteria bacterium]
MNAGETRRGGGFGRSLSGRLLLLTVGFALAAQVTAYVPIVAAQHEELLSARIAAAQTAVLALEETENNEVSPRLREELLANAGVKAVALKRDEARLLFLADDMPGPVTKVYDLRHHGWLTAIGDAAEALWGSGDRVLRIIDTPRLGGGQFIEAIAEEKPIREALAAFARRTFFIGLAIAMATGGLVFLALNLALVGPMRRLIRSMTAFREQPESGDRVLVPSGRRDEIGDAEVALADLQGEVRQSLTQRAHLAAMGAAVAKINHDLRNLLAGAQLASERLEDSRDKDVRRMAPRLVRAIDRAIALATDTLAYGKAGERAPAREEVRLRDLVQDAAAAAGAADHQAIRFENAVGEDATAWADPEQLFRILLNLLRNAAEAIEHSGETGRLTVEAERGPEGTSIEIADEGPGIPDAVLPHLFQPFGGSGKVSGTGLGLAIARELARNHGGDLTLLRTGPSGTAFRLTLPGRKGRGP